MSVTPMQGTIVKTEESCIAQLGFDMLRPLSYNGSNVADW